MRENLADYLEERRRMVDETLSEAIPTPPNGDDPARVAEAMRYSLLAGGKRLRPILALAGAEAVGGDARAVLPFAAAVELVHTYSLIHDDLPAMDDDDLRRGRPTSHKVFGEATAILAGDALLTEAFSLMTSPEATRPFPPEDVLWAVRGLAEAAGRRGMILGQAMDISSEGERPPLERLEELHRRKTGDLLLFPILLGARLGGADREETEALERYGRAVGLAFQIADDLLDIEGDAAVLGKNPGSDEAARKATYPALLGVEESRRRARDLVEEAEKALERFGENAWPLRELSRYIVERKH